MADDIFCRQVAERVLRNLDALADLAGLGSVGTVLLEFDTAPVAVVREADGAGSLITGRSPAAAAEVLLEARKRSIRAPQEWRSFHPNGAAAMFAGTSAGAGGDAGRATRLNDQGAQPTRSEAAHLEGVHSLAAHSNGTDASGLAARPGMATTDDLEIANVSLQPAGQAVTATVELVHGTRRVVATSTGRNAAERHLYLMAEAAARAVTEFLPPGYGVILGEIQPLPEELGGALKAAVLFMTPTEDRPLEGVASVADHPDTAPARTVLAAVCDHVRPLLGTAAATP